MKSSMSRFIVERIQNLMESAWKDNRRRLFEHEVYQILDALQLQTPRHRFIPGKQEIDSGLLAAFGSEKIVIKIVAANVSHKQKLGGVAIIHKDAGFVQYCRDRMLASFHKAGYQPEGVLLVEHINYSQAIGNEILLGFRESETFGPVISFSKGGSDAEHFAANYSSPNLILAPIDRDWASALLASTRIQKKYASEGKNAHVGKIVDAGVAFSNLAVRFSSFFSSTTEFVLTEFEVNPFIFTPQGHFIAIDGFAAFRKKRAPAAKLRILPRRSMKPFFEPVGIAVVGVSSNDSTKPGSIVFANMLTAGRPDVYAVNAKGGQVQVAGRACTLYKSVAAIDQRVDLVVVTVSASAVLPVVKECAVKKVKAVILIPGGFSEVSHSREAEEEILRVARQSGMRVMGPNCLGVIYQGKQRKDSVNTFFVPEDKFSVTLNADSNVAILSQSGALGITEITNLRNAISPRVIVSYGNQLDVDPCDLIQYFENDSRVSVIGCYIEGFQKFTGRKFFNIASGIRKPVIVYKAGRTEAGRRATESHTASIAGEYAVAKAAMKQAGLVVADTMIDHGDFIKTFALLDGFAVRGKRVAVVANAGYEKTYAADNLGELTVADLDEATLARLAQILPSIVAPGPLLDLTPMADDRVFEQIIDVVLQSDLVDVLLISVVPQSAVLHTSDAEMEIDEENLAARIVKLVHRYKKPTAVSVNVVSGTDAVFNRFGKTLEAGGVPTFLTAYRAMVCLNAFVRYHLLRKTRSRGEWLRE